MICASPMTRKPLPRGFYRRGDVIWISTDPVTKQSKSTGAKDIESALAWREARRRKAVPRTELKALWHACEQFDAVANPSSVVYFAQARATGLVKIGHSTDVANRMRSLGTACPGGLEVILLIRGDRAIERLCHAAFRPLRVDGEWFEYRDALVRFVEAMSEQPSTGGVEL